MKFLMTVILLSPVWVSCYLYYLSSTAPAGKVGLFDGKLRVCSSSSNCVNTEARGVDDPTPIRDSDGSRWQKLPEVIEEDGGRIIRNDVSYIHAIYKSSIFGFVDDIEFRHTSSGKTIHVRSASRVGRSDLGANLRRLERIRLKLGY